LRRSCPITVYFKGERLLERIFFKRKLYAGDFAFDLIVNGFLLFMLLIVLYPLYFIVIASFSDPSLVNTGQVIFVPKGFTLEGYKMIFRDSRVWQGYLNSIIYTGGFTLVAASITLLAGYAFSRRELYGKKVILVFYIIAMYFSGGLIPEYMVIKKLNLQNTMLIMMILGSLHIYYVFVSRAFFESTVSEELYEASQIDGCNAGKFFFCIVLPLSKAIIAVIALFYVVGQWNSYFKALVYLNDKKLYPLQLILREILIKSQKLQDEITDMHFLGETEQMAELVKYGLIMVATVPMLILYPFLQKYFVQGVMIGSIKG
jgi:putative aldouronate transport system permease protein